MQKGRCLVKPFIICAFDGYIVDIYGLYPATWNDARILKHILETDSDLVKLFKKEDILILDRGFRDEIQIFKDKYKINTMMPNLLPINQKQLTTEEPNSSRLCKKIRWVIESINGLLKECFRALDSRVENKALKNFLTDFRIIANKNIHYFILYLLIFQNLKGAFLNKFNSRLLSDSTLANEMAQAMIAKKDSVNFLMKIVKEERLNRMSQFKILNDLDEELMTS